MTVFLALTALNIYGQTCIYTGLSKTFVFQTNIIRIKLDKEPDSCLISVYIIIKTTEKTIQSIRFSSNFLLGDSSFVCCNNVRSYTTGKNINAEVIDNDYGDLIVADFNFDNKEDFAIKREEGGNGGPLYNFYIQAENTTFTLDKYLSQTMIWFPANIDKGKRTLTTVVHANAYQMSETTYKYDPPTNKWARVGYRLIGEMRK
jgi:hypothetical protein